MKGIVFLLPILLAGIACDKKEECISASCLQEATVKDLRSLDGCDFVFELSDGTRLIPERKTYIQAPKKADDPIYYFQLKDGEKVKISYRNTQLLGACMAGDIVFITCITLVETTGE